MPLCSHPMQNLHCQSKFTRCVRNIHGREIRNGEKPQNSGSTAKLSPGTQRQESCRISIWNEKWWNANFFTFVSHWTLLQARLISSTFPHCVTLRTTSASSIHLCPGLPTHRPPLLLTTNLKAQISYIHHHDHVPEGLGVFPIPWSSRWSWSLHLFLGRPMFLRLVVYIVVLVLVVCLCPSSVHVVATFGSMFVSILCTCRSHFW